MSSFNLNLSHFLAREDSLTEVPIPEMVDGKGDIGSVYLRPLTAKEVFAYNADGSESQIDSISELIVKCVVDVDGEPIFTVDSLDDLQNLDVVIFMRLSQSITRLMEGSGLIEGEDSSGTDGSDSPTN